MALKLQVLLMFYNVRKLVVHVYSYIGILIVNQ